MEWRWIGCNELSALISSSMLMMMMVMSICKLIWDHSCSLSLKMSQKFSKNLFKIIRKNLLEQLQRLKDMQRVVEANFAMFASFVLHFHLPLHHLAFEDLIHSTIIASVIEVVWLVSQFLSVEPFCIPPSYSWSYGNEFRKCDQQRPLQGWILVKRSWKMHAKLTISQTNKSKSTMTFSLLIHEHHSLLDLTKLTEISLNLFDGCILRDATNENLLGFIGSLGTILWCCMLGINLLSIKSMNGDF